MARRKRNNSLYKTLFRLGILILLGIAVTRFFEFTDTRRKLPPICNIEIPDRLPDREEQIIQHTGYTVSFNENWRLPNWVAYELTREETNGNTKRATHFVPDPALLGINAENSDYSHSGYDRGHMAPAADMKWSQTAMKESFYFSNICPQLHSVNAGDWKELEEKVREWAIQHQSVYVVSGPVMGENPKRIGKNRIAVPDAFFKVILLYNDTEPRVIGFLLKQEKGNRPLRNYAVTVDSVETLTGINFFPTLPDELENKIESTLNPYQWDL